MTIFDTRLRNTGVDDEYNKPIDSQFSSSHYGVLGGNVCLHVRMHQRWGFAIVCLLQTSALYLCFFWCDDGFVDGEDDDPGQEALRLLLFFFSLSAGRGNEGRIAFKADVFDLEYW